MAFPRQYSQQLPVVFIAAFRWAFKDECWMLSFCGKACLAAGWPAHKSAGKEFERQQSEQVHAFQRSVHVCTLANSCSVKELFDGLAQLGFQILFLVKIPKNQKLVCAPPPLHPRIDMVHMAAHARSPHAMLLSSLPPTLVCDDTRQLRGRCLSLSPVLPPLAPSSLPPLRSRGVAHGSHGGAFTCTWHSGASPWTSISLLTRCTAHLE